MTNLDSMNTKANRIMDEIEGPPQHTDRAMIDQIFDGDPSLFTDHERGRVEKLIATIQPRIKHRFGGSRDFLMQVTDAELEILHQYNQVLKKRSNL